MLESDDLLIIGITGIEIIITLGITILFIRKYRQNKSKINLYWILSLTGLILIGIFFTIYSIQDGLNIGFFGSSTYYFLTPAFLLLALFQTSTIASNKIFWERLIIVITLLGMAISYTSLLFNLDMPIDGDIISLSGLGFIISLILIYLLTFGSLIGYLYLSNKIKNRKLILISIGMLVQLVILTVAITLPFDSSQFLQELVMIFGPMQVSLLKFIVLFLITLGFYSTVMNNNLILQSTSAD